MTPSRSHLITAAALLTVTALGGAAARGFARSMRLPPEAPGAARTTFSAAAAGPVTFSGTLDRRAVQLGQDGIARMELVIAGAPDTGARPLQHPTDLVIVLDRSGSMDGDKIAQARAAVGELLDHLGPQDRFGLVTYADWPATEVALSPASEANRTRWRALVAQIAPAGGTNMSGGIDAGLQLIEQHRQPARVPRLIVISDGLANQGDPSFDGLTRRAQRAARGEYMLSTVGVGSDFNEQLLTAIADAGTGNYYYVADARELGNVFGREFDAARRTIASGLTVRIEPASGVRVIDAAGYPLESSDGAVVFRPGALFAGQERRIWLTLAVPQHAVGEYDIGRFALAYGDAAHRTELQFAETPRIACVRGDAEFYAGVDVDTWGRGLVVDAYNQMQTLVAREVQNGRRDEALERVRRFKEEASRIQSVLPSAPVAGQLDAASRLEERVGAAFAGPDQRARQNAFSKAASAAALDARRAGAKQ